MGSSQICFFGNRKRHLIVSLPFLLVLSLTQLRFMAEGRTVSKLVEAAQKGMEEEKTAVMRNMIGSRPPKCERMCSSCRPCEAVQVPATTQAIGRKRYHFSSVANSRGDDISNYKPMNWKCKCGNLFFNP